jgi:1-acyl-sn-glycerol-3-phosphate acyltransferase
MHQAVRSQPRLPDWLVRNRNFVLLWFAYGVAAVGDHLSEMALLQERGGLGRDDATRIQALISFGFFLPFVLLGPLAGWWSDRFARKGTMIAADVLRAVVVFHLAWIVTLLERWLEPQRFTTGPTSGAGDFAIVIPLAIVGTLAAFFSPARQAMLPTLVRDDQLVRANAMINALGTIGAITGGVVGGKLVDYLGPEGLHHNYHINALTFLCSAAFVSAIVMSRTRAVPHPPLTGVWTPIVQGFRYVRQHRRVLQMILLGSLFWGAAGIVISVVPAVVRDVFGGSIGDVAIFRGLIIVGLAVGAAGMSIVGPALPLKLTVLVGLFAGGWWVLALDGAYLLFVRDVSETHGRALSGGGVLTGLCLFGIGGAGAALLVTIMATIQHLVPDSRRGRVCGVSDMATMGALVLTSGVLGLAPLPNLDHYIPWLLAGTGLAMWLALGAAWSIYRRGVRVAPLTDLTLAVVAFYVRFWCRLKRAGPCTVPRSGSAIVAANHNTGLDPLLILTATPHRTISYLVEREYYENRLARFFMRMVDCIPVDRARPEKSAVAACYRALREGRVLGIFPHGRFAPPGEPEPEVKPGVGALALRTGAPVIPCHISGTTFTRTVFGSYLQRHRVRLRFGQPVDLSRFRGREREPEAAREATEVIMAQIAALRPDGE